MALRRATLVACALVALTTACSGSTVGTGPRFNGPTSVAAFAGYTSRYPDEQIYLAVASSRGDELRIIYPLSDTAVVGPNQTFPLSVPTASHPFLLASSSLNDRDEVAEAALPAGSNQIVPRPDLLVVSTEGSLVFQVVQTWNKDGEIVVDPEVKVDLTNLAEGAQILAMAAMPVPDDSAVGDGVSGILPSYKNGKAWLLVSLSGHRIALVEFQRTPNPIASQEGQPAVLNSVEQSTDPVLLFGPGSTTGIDLGVEVNGFGLLAPPPRPATSDLRSPQNLEGVLKPEAPQYRQIYLSTSDSVPATITGPTSSRSDGRFGLVRIEAPATGNVVDSWTASYLDAGGPTLAVAVTKVREDARRHVNDTSDDSNVYQPPVYRAFAVLDTVGCGSDQILGCGVATVDTVTGTLAADPGVAQTVIGPSQTVAVPTQGFRTPMRIPAVPLQIAVSGPPLGMGVNGPGNQVRSDKATEVVDNWVPANPVGNPAKPVTELLLAPSTGQLWTTAVGAVPSTDGRVYILDLARFGTPDDVSLLNDGNATRVTSARFSSSASGVLTSLGLRTDTWIGSDRGAGSDYSVNSTAMPAYIQLTPGYTESDSWAVVWQGKLPGLDMRRATLDAPGDGSLIVALQERAFDGTLILGPNVNDGALGIHAGDLVEIRPDVVQAGCDLAEGTIGNILPPSSTYPNGALALTEIPSTLASCPAELTATVDLRAGGLVLIGASTGYAGRPQLGTGFSLQWQDEAPLLAACQGGDRAGCEQLSLARKARRKFYPAYPVCKADSGTAADCYAYWKGLADPITTGPALAFTVGLVGGDVSGLERDSAVLFTTQSGMQPLRREPIDSSVPTSVVPLDVSSLPAPGGQQDRGVAFYSTFFGGTLFEFTPGSTGTVDIR
jgi:hypothetical protein